MGRKVHPIGFRLGYIKDWQSKWFADRTYTDQLHEDIMLRAAITRELANAGVARVEIERSANKIEVTVFTAKPGIVIGKRGAKVDELKAELEKRTGKKVKLNIQEIHQPELEAQLVAESIAEQINKRISYKRAMKQAVQRAMRLGAQGVKIKCSGRLGGAEMARIANESDGRVPRHTLRADIDYAQVHAHTTYGRIGVKVWIYKGEVFPDAMGKLQVVQTATTRPQQQEEDTRPRQRSGGRNDRGGSGAGGGGRGGPGGGGVVAVPAAVVVAPVAAVVAVPAAARARAVRRSDDYVDAQARQIPQAAARSHKGNGSARQLGRLWRFRADGAGSHLGYFAPDRGGPPRDHAPCQAWWQDLDSNLSRTNRSQPSRLKPAWVPARARSITMSQS